MAESIEVPKVRPMRLHVYPSASSWRWSVVAANGPKIASGDQGYQGATSARLVRFLGRFLRFDAGESGRLVHCRRHRSSKGTCRIWDIRP